MISPSRIMRLCDRRILHVICIFHYARIIVQGTHNLCIIVFLCNSQFFKFLILSSFLILSVSFLTLSVSDEVNLRKINIETTGNKQQNQQTNFYIA